MSEPKVLLVSMPWRDPNSSNLGLGILSPIIKQAGIGVETLYGEVLYPFSSNRLTPIYPFSTLPFLPHLYPNIHIEELWESLLEWILGESTSPTAEQALGDRDALLADFKGEVARAATCLDRCFQQVTAPHQNFDVIGFSVVLDSQTAASLTLARRLKEHDPSLKVVLGGAACLGEQADGIVEAFDPIDAVCHTEGEEVIVQLIQALRREQSLETVPGIAYRGEAGVVRHSPAPALIHDMDSLHLPEYDDFIEQHQRSEWRSRRPELYFESSRGCWWAQKRPCRFCGFNPFGRTFRSKSGARVAAELETLHRRHPKVQMYRAADNALDMRYFKTLFPRLAQLQRQIARPLKLFYEIRANLRRTHVALLAASGVTEMQLGIESFSDGILQSMNKGVTALANVQVLKWICEQPSFNNIYYNLISGTPGEQVRHYQQMLDWLPALSHLPPPMGVNRMMLIRFSEYFDRPQHYGLSRIRPKSYYQTVFGDRGVDVMKLSFYFDYDSEQDSEELRHWRIELARAVQKWRSEWEPGLAYVVDSGEYLTTVDRRGGGHQTDVISGQAMTVFRFLDQLRPREAIERRFNTVSQAEINCLLTTWQHRKWVLRDTTDRFVAVLPVVKGRGRS